MGGYVNIKTFAHKVGSQDIPAKEVSVAFELYSDVNRIAGANYRLDNSETPMYATVFELDQRDAWIASNATMFADGVPATIPDPGEEGDESE